MKVVTSFLCEHATSTEGSRVGALGIGITRVPVPLPLSFQHMQALFFLGYEAHDRGKEVIVTLDLQRDNESVLEALRRYPISVPQGNEETGAIIGLVLDESVLVHEGQYRVVCAVSNEELAALPFSVGV